MKNECYNDYILGGKNYVIPLFYYGVGSGLSRRHSACIGRENM